MKKQLLFIVMFLMNVNILAGCSGKDNQSDGVLNKESLIIGLAAPLSGDSAEYGDAFKKGAELAIKLANDAGGIDGKKIDLVVEDDKGDPKEAVNIANKLASDKSILAVIGHFNSSATLAAAPIYNKNKIVEISPSSSSPNVTDAGDYTFRVITTDAFQGEYVAKWTKEEKFKNVAIIYEQTDFGLGLSTVFKKSAKENGLIVVANESYVAGQTKDFSSILTKVKEAKPDVIFVGGLYNEGALIAKQSKQFGLNVQIMGVDSFYSDALIKMGGEAVEGVMAPGFFNLNSDNEKTIQFVNAYKEAYNENPGTYAAYTFDATSIVLEAIKKNGAEREKIKEFIATLKGYQGATGIHDFDENGDVLKEPEKLIVKDGKFQLYK
ncbi:ABC transporter substrate-binding protein [Neobacillus sp. NPDC093182]|uniref:ABC transporter substrate-binding protein n=1 Tax=Neobacillus sp. NPDC093182 TaxID=3364297 RepID=UPI003830D12C